jgi:5'-nucleotidase
VALPLMGFIEEKIDVVVSGINPNANIGHDVTYSGTVTAAMEAVITGRVPGIAISLDAPEYHSGPLDFGSAARVARKVTSRVLTGALPEGVLLNVNVPYLAEKDFKGTLVTRQGLRVYLDKLERRLDPRGRPYYWIGGEAPTGVLEEGTDFGSLKAGYVSITPLQLDLTACAAMDVMKEWTWK